MMEFLLRRLFLQLVLTCLFTSGSSAEAVTCTVGDECDLPCSGPQGEVLVLEWIKDERPLLLYRGGRIIQNSQDQRFRGRVHLRDPELRRADMTVTLKDLTLEDTGTYICEGLVQTSGGKGEVFTREVHLSVSERTEDARSGKRERLDTRMSDSDVPDAAKGTDLALTLGVISAVAVVVCAVTAGLYWKRNTIKDLPQKRKIPETSNSPPTDTSTPLFSPSAV